MMTDPIADMLTRIRNANATGKAEVGMPASKLKVGVAQILQEEGFVDSYEVQETKPASTLVVKLKYGPDGEKVIRHIERVSKPGCRVYKGCEDLPRPLQGLGIAIVSTSQGVMSDRKCRETRVGGELLAEVS